MEGRVGYRPGGILGLCRLLEEHGGAIRYDLLTVGRTLDDLGTRRLTWTDLLAVVQHAPPGSALSRSLHGEFALWSPNEYLLALVADLLQAANWQRGGGKGTKPKPLARPTDKAVKRLTVAELKKDRMQSGVIGTAMPLDELKAWVRRNNDR